MGTISLKALARKLLERNSQGNSTETQAKISGNFRAANEGKSFPKKTPFEDFYIIQTTATGKTIYLTPKRDILEKYSQDGEAWFLPDEIDKLKGLDMKALDRVIDIKEIYSGSRIIQ